MSPQLFTFFILLSFIGAAKVEEQYKKGRGNNTNYQSIINSVSPVETNSGTNASGTGESIIWLFYRSINVTDRK